MKPRHPRRDPKHPTHLRVVDGRPMPATVGVLRTDPSQLQEPCKALGSSPMRRWPTHEERAAWFRSAGTTVAEQVGSRKPAAWLEFFRALGRTVRRMARDE